MEVADEHAVTDSHAALIIKGKRTKRPRPLSPPVAAVTSSSSSGGGDGYVGGRGHVYCSPIQSPTSSTSTEEDQDMANCLILLAQGVGLTRQLDPEEGEPTEKHGSRRSPEIVATGAGKGDFYLYECKTCYRTFPSFQALGGHRASHKKPKAAAAGEEKKATATPCDAVDDDGSREGQFSKGLNKPKIHECSICGSEFTSGQALGGHMRRHRTPTTARIITTTNSVDGGASATLESRDDEDQKPRQVLTLDLNLPAPEADHRETRFQFTPNQQHLIFSTTALVGCHY